MAGILIIAEHKDLVLSEASNELIGHALALSTLAPVYVAILGNNPELSGKDMKLAGVKTLFTIDIGIEHFDSAAYLTAVIALGKKLRCQLILTPHCMNSMTWAPAVAARLGCGFATDVFGITEIDGVFTATRSAYGSKVERPVTFSQKSVILLTVRSGSFAPNSLGAPGLIESFTISTDWKSRATEHINYVFTPKSDIDVGKAEFILSIGRGIQDEVNIPVFEDLAKALGATLGCSRPLVDAGWMPKPHQVGQSGTTASNCKLYLALGISGAVQHLQGMKHVETIIAINTDPSAPIFNVADYGATVDVLAFAGALDKAFK